MRSEEAYVVKSVGAALLSLAQVTRIDLEQAETDQLLKVRNFVEGELVREKAEGVISIERARAQQL